MKRVVLFILIVIGITFLPFIFAQYTKGRLLTDIRNCGNTSPALRFSCFRNSIEKYYHQNPKAFFNDLKQKDNIFTSATSSQEASVSYGVFGTNCHTFYHAAGDFIADNLKPFDLKQAVDICPVSCTGGCVMGLYKRTALKTKYDPAVLASFYTTCDKRSLHQCAHEIGHNLHDKYVISVLGPIDDLSQKNYQLKQPVEYQYQTFPTANLNGPFEDCRKILPKEEWPYCYTGIGHNLFLFSEFSNNGYKDEFDKCAGTDKENVEDCYGYLIYRVGINDAATKFLSGKFEDGINVCTQAVTLANRPNLLYHCYLGIGGGIGLFVDSEYAPVKVTENNIEKIRSDVLSKIDLCQHAPEAQRENCYTGLLGTPLKKLYNDLNIQNEIINKLLPQIKSNFQVVG